MADVKQALAWLSAGKKVRCATWFPGGFLELKEYPDDSRIVDEDGDEMGSLLVSCQHYDWVLYEECPLIDEALAAKMKLGQEIAAIQFSRWVLDVPLTHWYGACEARHEFDTWAFGQNYWNNPCFVDGGWRGCLAMWRRRHSHLQLEIGNTPEILTPKGQYERMYQLYQSFQDFAKTPIKESAEMIWEMERRVRRLEGWRG